MITENIKALMTYRIEQADESLEAATALLAKGMLCKGFTIIAIADDIPVKSLLPLLFPGHST